MENLISRLSAMIEDEMPETSGMQATDPKVKYARIPKRMRPNNSRHKARSTLMNTTNPGSTAPSGEQTVGANAKHEAVVEIGSSSAIGHTIAKPEQSVALTRLIQELAVQLADPRTSERDNNTERIAKRDIRVKRAVEKKAKQARGAPEQEYPWTDPEKTRMIRRTSITTSQYGDGF